MYRVLVVDDEKLERDGIRFLLSMEEGEWEIYEAANGKLALNELRKHPVDLMLTDIKMPHMDGLELSKKAREEYPDLEIIIFSGYGDFAFAQEAIRYGVTDYVLKPVDPDRFHDTIQKIQKEIASRKNKEQQAIKEKSFLQQYFLLGYIYSGDQERLKELWIFLSGSSGTVQFLLNRMKLFLILPVMRFPLRSGKSFAVLSSI